MEKLLTIQSMANELGISYAAVLNRLAARGIKPIYKLGKTGIFAPSALPLLRTAITNNPNPKESTAKARAAKARAAKAAKARATAPVSKPAKKSAKELPSLPDLSLKEPVKLEDEPVKPPVRTQMQELADAVLMLAEQVENIGRVLLEIKSNQLDMKRQLEKMNFKAHL